MVLSLPSRRKSRARRAIARTGRAVKYAAALRAVAAFVEDHKPGQERPTSRRKPAVIAAGAGAAVAGAVALRRRRSSGRADEAMPETTPRRDPAAPGTGHSSPPVAPASANPAPRSVGATEQPKRSEPKLDWNKGAAKPGQADGLSGIDGPNESAPGHDIPKQESAPTSSGASGA